MKNKFSEYAKFVGKSIYYKKNRFNVFEMKIDEELVPMKVIGIVLVGHTWNYIFTINKDKIELKMPCSKIMKELETAKCFSKVKTTNNSSNVVNNINDEDYCDFTEDED